MTRALRVMSAGFVVVLSVGVVAAIPAGANRLRRANLVPAKFSCTRAEQTYSVPAGVRALKVKAIGAAGASSNSNSGPAGSGGPGAVVGAWVRLPRATSTVYVEVGCAGSAGSGGFNGGGNSASNAGTGGGGGGGASDVRLDPMSTALTTTDSRLVVAGGGGGGGVCSNAGGAAGHSKTGAGKGGNGDDPCPGSATAGGKGGFGGTAGGPGGSHSAMNSCNGIAGSLGQGGAADPSCDASNFGGGGGGGYYGGGGGGDGGSSGGGGGAGSSFWVSGATHTSMSLNTTSLPPKVVLTPVCLVPTLKGKTLAKAKTALADAHCALGTVTKKTSTGKAGIVLSQNPKPGTILTIGGKVAVVVSKT